MSLYLALVVVVAIVVAVVRMVQQRQGAGAKRYRPCSPSPGPVEYVSGLSRKQTEWKADPTTEEPHYPIRTQQ